MSKHLVPLPVLEERAAREGKAAQARRSLPTATSPAPTAAGPTTTGRVGRLRAELRFLGVLLLLGVTLAGELVWNHVRLFFFLPWRRRHQKRMRDLICPPAPASGAPTTAPVTEVAASDGKDGFAPAEGGLAPADDGLAPAEGACVPAAADGCAPAAGRIGPEAAAAPAKVLPAPMVPPAPVQRPSSSSGAGRKARRFCGTALVLPLLALPGCGGTPGRDASGPSDSPSASSAPSAPQHTLSGPPPPPKGNAWSFERQVQELRWSVRALADQSDARKSLEDDLEAFSMEPEWKENLLFDVRALFTMPDGRKSLESDLKSLAETDRSKGHGLIETLKMWGW